MATPRIAVSLPAVTRIGVPRKQAPNPEVAQLVSRYKLRRAGARPPIWQYTQDLWQRRHFITTFSTANNAVGYSESFLGQAWQLLTPLLNVGVYYLIFGVLLHTRRGVHNFIGFLVVGIFIFTYMQTATLNGAKSISANVALTRILHFPRAVLPVSSTLVALQRLLFSLVIMVPIVLITGEPLTWRWLLAIPAIALESLFCLGLAFIFARIGAKIPDTSQLLPFILRTWLYMSGVFYNVTVFGKGHAHWVKTVLEINPGFVYINLVRQAVMSHQPTSPHEWLLGVAWAVVILLAGYVYFWQAEEQYGRV
jgi:teichoic acid transport system permease protein